MQISPIQQTQNTNFKAKLQLSGNASLLKNEQTLAIRTIVDKIGSQTDIVDINLTEKLINNGFIPIAAFANNKLSQFIGEFKNGDVYSGIINALEQTKEIFPSITAIITSSLATENTEDIKKAEEVEKNTVIDSLEKTSKLEPSNNKNQNNNLEMINTKINEFMDYMNNRGYGSIEESFILMTMRNSIHNDSFLQNEYSKRMRQKTYIVFDRYSDDADIAYKHYTGNDRIDINCEDGHWHKDSTKTINEMLQENDLKEKIANSILKLLSNNKSLDNFSIKQLVEMYEKLNKKFDDYNRLFNSEYSGANYILIEHPITHCIPVVASYNSDLSKRITQLDEMHSYQKNEELRKSLVVDSLLKDKLEYRTQLIAQLLLNHPYLIPVEKQKDILDKIIQSTIRENTPEEIERIKNFKEVYGVKL